MEPNLGELTTQTERDAIHIAVIPLVADNSFSAGMQVLLSKDGKASSEEGTVIGIVDPFLNVEISRGDRFWVFLYPNTVTGMKHHWSHPVIDKHFHPKEEDVKNEIDKICNQINDYNYYDSWTVDKVLFLADKYWQHGDFYCGDYDDGNFNMYYQQFRPLLKLLGYNLPSADEDGSTYFRCAC